MDRQLDSLSIDEGTDRYIDNQADRWIKDRWINEWMVRPGSQVDERAHCLPLA